jgi:hypothetical protein
MSEVDVNIRRIQRLVDGELGIDETRRLVVQADLEPEKWKQIGAAFIEEQLWRKAFLTEVDRYESDAKPAGRSRMTVKRDSRFRPLGWLSLAATMLLGLTIAFVLDRSGDPKPSTDRPPDHSLANVGNLTRGPFKSEPGFDRDPNQGLNTNPAVYRMQVEDNLGNSQFESDIPLYSPDHPQAAELFREMEIPLALRQRAAESGLQLQQNIRYLSGRFDNGRSFVIPIRKFVVTPVQ